MLVIYSSDSRLAMARGKKGSKNRVQNVRVVDEFAGSDGVKVDRMLSALHTSENQARVLCTSFFEIRTTSSGPDLSGYYGGDQVRDTDEFKSMMQQFGMYRISAIRFDVYDINPTTSVAHAFSTYHSSSIGPISAFAFADVVDSADSQIIAPGTGTAHFTWVAKSTNERGFYTTARIENALTPPETFGGLRWALANASSDGRKYQVAVKAIVDFRARH